jgi:hypothetical protein
MVMYAIALMPLLDKHRPEALGIKFTQAWYADDAANAARLQALRIWWDKLCKLDRPRVRLLPQGAEDVARDKARHA